MGAREFTHFVILAGMRTGSNLLQSLLNANRGVTCHGELFNPGFVGGPKHAQYLGFTLKRRNEDPLALLQRLRDQPDGIHGFRLFEDHDPRALEACLNDRACAKIVLTRNPVDSYVSLKIARKTGQWRLGDMKHARTARIRFDAAEFDAFTSARTAFHRTITRTLQRTGQAAFRIGYADLADSDAVDGLIRYLGIEPHPAGGGTRPRKQNPQPLREKVSNFAEMQAALAGTDHFATDDLPSFEPARPPAVRTHIAAPRSPVLFMPIRSGPTAALRNWLAELDKARPEELQSGFTQKTLRQWKRRMRRHVSFTVVRHPVARLHDAFQRHILLPGDSSFPTIRETLKKAYGLPLPDLDRAATTGPEQYREAFLKFAEFVRGNLAGQTAIRVDPAWASQAAVLQGMCAVAIPDHVFRENELAAGLAFLAGQLGLGAPAYAPVRDLPFELSEIYGKEIETAVRAAYQRDYMMFGFGPWNEDRPA